MENKPKLLFICNWGNNVKYAWSGTPNNIKKALSIKFQIIDGSLKLNFFEKVIARIFAYRLIDGKIKMVDHNINPIKKYFFKRKAKKMISKFDGEYVLEIGDYYSCKTKKIFSYQDLNLVKLRDIYENEKDIFAISSYCCSKKDIIKREKHSLTFFSNMTKCFCMGRWLEKYSIENINDKFVYVGGGANVYDSNIVKHSTAPNYLFVGKDFIRKGGDLVCEAFVEVKKKLPHATLTICGPIDIPDKYKIEGINFVGEQPFEKVNELMNKASVFVMPSRFEAFGIVFVEALIKGLPVIAANRYEMEYFIKNGHNGYLIDNYDKNELATDMIKIASEESIFENVLKERDSYISEYTWEAVAERMYKEIINS